MCIIKGSGSPLLDKPAIKDLRIIAKVESTDSKELYQKICPTLFTRLAEYKGEYEIKFMRDTKPYAS